MVEVPFPLLLLGAPVAVGQVGRVMLRTVNRERTTQAVVAAEEAAAPTQAVSVELVAVESSLFDS